MSDASVAAALRSAARLVVVEAPGGCGKTYQGAEFAREAAPAMGGGRLLILTHTNAACDVFAAKIKGVGSAAEIRTIDGLITEIAGAYHKALCLPADVGAWARRHIAYDQLAIQVARLLAQNAYIAESLARRYPMIICDEHQDASADQHAIIMSLHQAGSRLRIFGDPLQQIFGKQERGDAAAKAESRWTALKQAACQFEELDFPHRWKDGDPALGHWILAARSTLKAGGQIDLTAPHPQGLTVHYADNTPQNPRGFYVAPPASKPIYERARAAKMLVLSGTNDICTALRGFFNRSYPLWEGHVRDDLATLIAHCRDHAGNPEELARGTLTFLGGVASGFAPSDQGKILIAEAASGCAGKRKLKPAMIQSMATVSRRSQDGAPTPGQNSRTGPSARFIKPRGLEFDNVLLLPCDRQTFSNTPRSRAKLYVAMSRAKKSLMLVVSRTKPSPLFKT
jgi:DNA helicase-2/ATP-dependent DNA helicase PcrA